MVKPSPALVMKARLFDADRSDKEIDLSANTVGSVGDRQLLWVDLLLTKTPADADAER
jgi:hypothetical protein